MNRIFFIAFFSGLLCLGAGAAALPSTGGLSAALAISIGLIGGGLLLMVLGMATNVRMRTAEAILTEAHRQRQAVGGPPSPNGPERAIETGAPGSVVVDMIAFREASRATIESAKAKLTGLMLVALAGGFFLLFEAAESFRAGSAGLGVEFGTVGLLLVAMGSLFALILYAPDLPTHPVRVEIDSSGISLVRSRGAGSRVTWATAGLTVYLIDTGPSVRRTPAGVPTLSLFADGLGTIPLSAIGAEGLKRRALEHGLQIHELPQGKYGTLPRRVRMNLPFGSKVATISRP
ncbi:MAG: hypothetical protein L3K02_04560 [Thermoplasmata archaeon]|nr:hypothetical protein [Thermoplasmata archaeon]